MQVHVSAVAARRPIRAPRNEQAHGRSSPAPPRSRSSAPGTAFASTTQFGHRPGRHRAPPRARSISGDQYIKPIGERLVINTARSCRPRSARTARHLAASVTDGADGAAIVDLKTWKVTAARRQRRGGGPAHQRQRRRPGRPDVLARRQAAVAGPDRRLHQVHRERGRHPRQPDVDRDPAADGPKHALVGAAVFSADGATVYSAVNGQNRVVAIDAGDRDDPAELGRGQRPATGRGGRRQALRQQRGRPSGQARRDHDQLLRHPGAGRPGTRGASTTGTVSVIDLAEAGDRRPARIDVGSAPDRPVRQERARCSSPTPPTTRVGHRHRAGQGRPDHRHPAVAGGVGYEPDAVTLTDDGHLLVTLGRANAVAVYRCTSPLEPVSYVGLLPTDYFPAEITTVGKQTSSPTPAASTPVGRRSPPTRARHDAGHRVGTHDTTSLTRFTLPSDRTIRDTRPPRSSRRTAGATRDRVKHAKGGQPRPAGAGPGAARRPLDDQARLPARQGEPDLRPGLRRHPEGNGDPALAQFGENVTPNQHALASSSGCTTTPTTSAPTPPRATTG